VSPWIVWRGFALRRALRIFPLAYVAMAIVWLLHGSSMVQHPWLYLTYTANVAIGLSYDLTPELSHFWSLAVEEHFYLLWPILLLFIPRRSHVAVVLSVLVAVCAARIATAMHWGPWAAYTLTWSRLDALAFGGLMAMVQPRVSRVALAGGAVLVLAAFLPHPSSLWVGVNESGIIIVEGAIVLAVTRGWGARLLTLRPLVYLGTISYGMYVWQQLVPWFVRRLGLPLDEAEGWPLTLVVVVGTVLLASISWFLFERPCNELKRYVDYVPSVGRASQPRAELRDGSEVGVQI
jgi:peptidoglycan/LPS O-acetylase OafA/YrhL